MKKFCVLFVLSLIASIPLFAQSPSIKITYPGTACLNAVQKIQVTVTGKYNADNQFTVQIRKGDNLPVISEIPARLVDDRIEVVHSDSSLSIPRYVQMRVATTSPKTESNWVNVDIHTKGSVNLALAASDTINPGEDLTLKFTAFTKSTATVTLNDSSYFTLSSFEEGYFVNLQYKGANTTAPFYIAHAENVCGPMKVSGEVKATLNPTSLRTLSVSPQAVCEGSEIRVNFATSGPALPASTKYRLRISVFQGDHSNVKTVEVPAQLKDNVLVATFPTSFNVTRRAEYMLRIITENPALLGANTFFDFVVYPRGSAVINTPSKTIEMGEKLPVGITFSGIAPYSATLQDGTVISSSQTNSQIDVRPEKTTSYTIKSVANGCGVQTVTSGSTMVVTVKPGIAMEPSVGERFFCAGSKGKIRMLSNIAVGDGTTFTVNGIVNEQKIYSFPAKKVGDYLEFDIPVLPKGTDLALGYDKIGAFYISSSNPSYKSGYYYDYGIRSMPEMVVLPHSVLNYKNPSEAGFGYGLYGNGPFKIEDAAGKIYNIDGYSAWYPNFYMNKTQDFKLKSISNACFKNETVPTVRLTLDTAGAAPGIYVQPLDKVICKQDSLEITFIKTGAFNPGNVFKIEGYIDCCTFQTLATVSKDGKHKIKVPVSQGQSGYPNFRVVSSNPAITSNQFETQMQGTPTDFNINPPGTREAPVEYLQGQEVSLWVSNREGGLSAFTYSDGTGDHTQELNSSVSHAVVQPPVGVVSAYTIKSARNQCGSFPVNLTTYIRVVPYRIVISAGESGAPLPACRNGSLVVPFVILDGDASKATFSLQIARDKTSEFTDLATGLTSRTFSITVPESVAPGRYQMRVASSDGSVSNAVDLVIGSAPSATISSAEKDPIVLNPGQGIYAMVNFTGTAPWTMIYENSEKQSTDNNPYQRPISAIAQKDFSLISVYNNCGYGPVSGKVSVKVHPILSVLPLQDEVCEGATVRVFYQLQGDASLDKDYIVFELVNTRTGKVTGVDSTRVRAGTLALKIPANLGDDYYRFRGVVRSYKLSTSTALTIKTKVDVSIIGNTTTNPGESAQIQIRSNKSANEAINYRLSDGQTGTFYGGSGNSEFFLKVSPTKTTTYTLASVDNGCGEGKKSGSATVEVNPPSERTVTVTSWEPSDNSAFCLGDAILVHYAQKGSFSAGNKMTVQFSDTTGRNFKSVTTTGNASPLKASVPADFIPGKQYRMRVVASDAGTGSGAYEFPLSPGTKSSARFASESIIQDVSGAAKLVVLLSGTGPWDYQVGSPLGIKTEYATSATDTIFLYEKPLAEYYKILQVSNRCGPGTVEKPDVVQVEVITGEPSPSVTRVTVAPNPADNRLLIKFPDAAERTIRLVNAGGVPMLFKRSSLLEDELNISQLPAGIYVLSIEGKNFKSAHKIIKR